MWWNTVFTSKFGTMKPERLLTDITGAEFVEPQGFKIEMKLEGDQIKSIDYEALDKKSAKQVVAKINYLK